MIEERRHDDVLELRGSSRVSRAMGFAVHAYLVRGVLVDTLFPALGGDVAAWLAARRPAGALLTHHHEDHAGNISVLASRGLPAGMASTTLARVRRPAPVGYYRRLCWGVPAALAADPAPFAADGLELIPAPGHSMDHHVVWDRETGTVFGGDLFLGVKVRIAHPGEDVRGQPAVLRRIAALGPVRFFDAHRGLVPDPVAALRAKADWIEEIADRIARRAADGWAASAITRDVLGRGDLTGLVSRGDYAKRNLVDALLATRVAPTNGPGGQ